MWEVGEKNFIHEMGCSNLRKMKTTKIIIFHIKRGMIDVKMK